jgi:hypothetical protein
LVMVCALLCLVVLRTSSIVRLEKHTTEKKMTNNTDNNCPRIARVVSAPKKRFNLRHTQHPCQLQMGDGHGSAWGHSSSRPSSMDTCRSCLPTLLGPQLVLLVFAANKSLDPEHTRHHWHAPQNECAVMAPLGVTACSYP